VETLDLESVLVSCRYYPVSVDIGRRLIWFAEVERETYRRAGFLVPNQTPMGRERYGFNLDDVALRDLSLPIGGAPSHYILISAFCCSTLLARLLDRVPGCLVLKEPSVLGQLSMLRYRPGTAEMQAAREAEWKPWGTLGIRLLTRTFEPGETVVIKASDVCNAMVDVLLANDSRSRAVLLSVPLRTFVLSVLKSEERREWTRKRAEFWQNTLALFPALSDLRVAELDDARKAAYVWMVTGALWGNFRGSVGTERLLLMDGEDVSERPGPALRQVASFFGIPLAETEMDEIVADPVLERHSKFPGRPYDSATRQKDRESWEKQFSDEADRAIGWSEPIREALESDGIDLSSMAQEAGEEAVL
jgi:hypothetical protein